MFIERIDLTLTVDASGDLTTYSPKLVTGRVLQMRYVPGGGGTNLATGADVNLTGETTGVAIATLADIGTAAFTKAVRQASHGIDGAAALYAGGGSAVNEPVFVAGERIKVVVAQGGVSKTGTLHLWVG